MTLRARRLMSLFLFGAVAWCGAALVFSPIPYVIHDRSWFGAPSSHYVSDRVANVLVRGSDSPACEGGRAWWFPAIVFLRDTDEHMFFVALVVEASGPVRGRVVSWQIRFDDIEEDLAFLPERGPDTTIPGQGSVSLMRDWRDFPQPTYPTGRKTLGFPMAEPIRIPRQVRELDLVVRFEVEVSGEVYRGVAMLPFQRNESQKRGFSSPQ